MLIEELSDGRFVGLISLEIMSFPVPDEHEALNDGVMRMASGFARLIQEYSRLGAGATSMAEVAFITEAVAHQTFAARVRIFLTLRVLGASRYETENWLSQLKSSLVLSLETLRFRLSEDASNEMLRLTGRVDSHCAMALVKQEMYAAPAYASYPYYFASQWHMNSGDNFESLIGMLSQCPGCMTVMQLFPTALSAQERAYLAQSANEVATLLHNARMSGMGADPSLLQAEASLNSCLQSADGLLGYNLLVFGGRAHCISVCTKLIGMLSGVQGTGAMCYDLSNDQINPAQNMLLYPWNVNSRVLYACRNQEIAQAVPLSGVLMRLPFLVSAAEAAIVFRLPLRTAYMAPLHQTDRETKLEQFDPQVSDPRNVQLGVLLNREDVRIGCPDKALTKHMLVVGMPGSGKTTFSINLLLQFARRGVPFLAIEPTKAEYRAMIDALPDLQIFTPGNNGVSPFVINPFIPPRGISVEKYIPSLFGAFHVAFSMPSPLDVIFMHAIRQCYLEYGWKDYSCAGDKDVTPFGIYEFILVFKRILEQSNYSREVKGNLQSGGIFRLMNLIEQNSNIYDTVHTVPLEDLLQKPTVLELNAIDDSAQKALLMSLMLINICIYTKQNQRNDGKLKNILLLDEAHVLLSPGSSDGSDAQNSAVRRLQNMIVEIRSYGTGIIIADQSPSRVTREVVANTDIKVSFRLVQGADRSLIADSCNMTERAAQELSRLHPGQAYAYYSRLENPQLIVTPDIREDSGIRLNVPDAEIARRMTYWKTHGELLKPFPQCAYCKACAGGCDMQIRAQAEYLANRLMAKYASAIDSDAALVRHAASMRKILQNVLADYPPHTHEQLIRCCQLRFIRKIQLNSNIVLKDSAIAAILRKEDEPLAE